MQMLIFWCDDVTREYLPSGSLWDGFNPATGVYHSGTRLQQQLMEGSLPEELVKLFVTHFLQGLHAAVEQRVGAPEIINIKHDFSSANCPFCKEVRSHGQLQWSSILNYTDLF